MHELYRANEIKCYSLMDRNNCNRHWNSNFRYYYYYVLYAIGVSHRQQHKGIDAMILALLRYNRHQISIYSVVFVARYPDNKTARISMQFYGKREGETGIERDKIMSPGMLKIRWVLSLRIFHKL